MKILYRILIVSIVYIGSVLFFAGSMKVNALKQEIKLTDMSETTLPVISFRIDECEVNRVHGYCSATEEMLIRESMTPLTSEQSMIVVINEGNYNIKKLTYEVIDAENGKKIEEGTVIAFDKEEDDKTAKLKIKEALVENKEYILKVTLISNESKRIYYYTRLLLINNSNLAEKLNFVEELHNDFINKNTENNFKKYLEYKSGTENTSFARVNIYSSEDMVSFGALNPQVIYQELPMITEYAKDTASVVIDYFISVDVGDVIEYYRVKDYYRFGYTSLRVYLYNFEREMESIFMPENVSLKKSEFKIGITEDYDIHFFTNSTENIMAFIRDRELWSYNAVDNVMTKIFSFKQENTDYIRDVYDQHDIRIMNVDESGNVYFMVYGYMNRGEYEGRVGVIIYEYECTSGYIKEKAYIPMNTTYQILKEEIGDIVFYNQYDTAYFMIYKTIYSYNFVSKILTVHAENVDDDAVIFNEKGKYAVWQNSNEKAESITILLLDTGGTVNINAESNTYIKLLNTVDESFLYGFVNKSDAAITNIGTNIYPMYKVILSSREAETLRVYEKEGYYVTSAEASLNKITFYRTEKSFETYSGYAKAKDDHMLNSVQTKEESYRVTSRATEKMFIEYYIALPFGYEIQEIPEIQTVKNCVISEDTTLRINKQQDLIQNYYAYSYGKLILSGSTAGKAVLTADKAVGTVMDVSGRITWQRGAKSSKYEISGITEVFADENYDSMQAVLKMMFQYKGTDVDTSRLSRKEKSVMEWIRQYLKIEPLDLSGATLNEVLYFVYKNRPVIAMKNDKDAVLIIGYDSSSITVIDPVKGRTEKVGISDAEDMFEKAGNVFVSYIE